MVHVAAYEVVEVFPNGMFKVKLDGGQDVLGSTAGKNAPLPHQDLPATCEDGALALDQSRGRIVYRFK